MTIPPRIYDARVLDQIAELFSGISELFSGFEDDLAPSREQPLYIFSTEIVIRHKDGFTVGRIGMDDFLYFEITDENYGDDKVKKDVKVDGRDFFGTVFEGQS